MKIFCTIVLVLFITVSPVFCQPRSFDAIFPNLPEEIRNAAFSADGYIKSAERAALGDFVCTNPNNLDPHITGSVLDKNPVIAVESLIVIPGNKSLLDAYNTLGNIRGLKGRLYRSHSRGESIPLFKDATRIASASKTTPVADPPPSSSLPRKETVYLKLNDANFGASYYRGDLSLDQYGLRYSLSNNKNLVYFIFPVIKEEKFTAQLYFEPVQEGMLLYSIAGADVSDFISGQIDMPSAIAKRLAVIISWVTDGLKN